MPWLQSVQGSRSTNTSESLLTTLQPISKSVCLLSLHFPGSCTARFPMNSRNNLFRKRGGPTVGNQYLPKLCCLGIQAQISKAEISRPEKDHRKMITESSLGSSTHRNRNREKNATTHPQPAWRCLYNSTPLAAQRRP